MSEQTLEQQIKSLREQGASYSEIQKQLNCAKSTISYYLGEGQKQKTRDRTTKMRAENPILQKKDHFLNSGRDARKPVFDKVRSFQAPHRSGKLGNTIESNFTWEQLLEKFDGKCYLTGRDIDMYKTSEYQLDHIIPRSKGGTQYFR